MSTADKPSKGDGGARETVQKAIDAYAEYADFSSSFFPHVELVSASGPRAKDASAGIAGAPEPEEPLATAVYRFTVPKSHCNRLGTLHGGAAATLFDFATTMPLVLVSRPGFWRHMGVSRNLSVTYLRPAPSGTTVLVECQVVAVGSRLCSLRGVMRREDNGQIVSTCEHGKVNIDPPVTPKV